MKIPTSSRYTSRAERSEPKRNLSAMPHMVQFSGDEHSSKPLRKTLWQSVKGIIAACWNRICDFVASLFVKIPMDPKPGKSVTQGASSDLTDKEKAKTAERIFPEPARIFSSPEITRRVLTGLAGNEHLEKPLTRSIRLFHGALRDSNALEPALYLYLPGQAQKEKRQLLTNLQTELNHDPDNLIHIDMSKMPTRGHLIKALQKASPLAGKTLWLDEMQSLDSSAHGRQQIVEFLKPLFESENAMLGLPHHEWEAHGIDPKHAIVAVSATTKGLGEMTKAMAWAASGADEALASRILGHSQILDVKPTQPQ